MDPLTILTFNDTLASQHLTVFTEGTQFFKAGLDAVNCVLRCGLIAKRIEDLIRMMVSGAMVVMVVMVMSVLMFIVVIVIMMVAAALRIIAFFIVIIVIIVVMVVMLVLMFVVIVVIMVVMIVVVALFSSQKLYSLLQGILVFHGFQHPCAVQHIPVSGNDDCVVIVRS